MVQTQDLKTLWGNWETMWSMEDEPPTKFGKYVKKEEFPNFMGARVFTSYLQKLEGLVAEVALDD